jgi:MATE family multidrug resistance protein
LSVNLYGSHHSRRNGNAYFAAYAIFLHVFGVPESLQPKASLFLHAIGFGMPAVTMYAALRGYSEALGHPRPVTVISLLALVVLIP